MPSCLARLIANLRYSSACFLNDAFSASSLAVLGHLLKFDGVQEIFCDQYHDASCTTKVTVISLARFLKIAVPLAEILAAANGA